MSTAREKGSVTLPRDSGADNLGVRFALDDRSSSIPLDLDVDPAVTTE